MINQIIVSRQTNPYQNIAYEKYLLDTFQDGVILYLWQNAPSVIVGRNQNLFCECDLSYLEKHKILPVRRFSGGGAVYHDMGNVNFTFLLKEDSENFDKIHEVVKETVHSLGVICEFSGRNDMLCDGKKFSGHAYLLENGILMYHGTIMASVDFLQLERAITPSIQKLNSKGIASVRSRVMNLSENDKDITTKKIVEAFIMTFRDRIGMVNDTIVYFDEKTSIKEVETMANKLASDKWLYGESPEYNVCIEKRVEKQNFLFRMNIQDGVVSKVMVETDSLLVDSAKKYQQALLNQPYFPDTIDLMIEKMGKL